MIERLGPYRIDRILGRGGMGTVYAGTDNRTGSRAAIKVLAAALAEDDRFRERFSTEVETLKTLRHPNIVELFGYGEQDGHLFYSMELVEGHSLQDELLAGRRFNWREATQIGIDVCQALKHAHDRGVVHRDLKPANLLLTPDERVKLSDFGIAKLFGGSRVTAEGGVLGTADYMSPEQAEGRPATARSDLYSLGCVLYALLARRAPFASKSLPEVLHRLRYEQPQALSQYVADLPDELEAIVHRLLEKEPQQRIGTATALAKRFEAILEAMSLKMSDDEQVGYEPTAGQDKYLGATKRPSRTGDADESDRARQPRDSAEPPDADRRDQPRGDEAADLGKTLHHPTVAPLRPTAPLTEESAPPRLADTPQADDDGELRLQDEPPAAATSPQPAGRFTVVDDNVRRRADPYRSHEHDEDPKVFWLKLALLLVVSALIVLGGWYALRPPSADALFQRIAAAAEQGGAADLAGVDGDIDRFLNRFPDDRRAAEVKQYQEDVELFRLQRRFETRVRRRGSGASLAPIEQLYLEAARLIASEPEQAVVRLQALVDLYPNEQAGDESARQCVELARRQLTRLRATINRTSHEQLALIEQRLDAADRLSTQHPEQATAIWQAIIRLYGDKPWAEAAVARAQRALQSSNDSSAASTSER